MLAIYILLVKEELVLMGALPRAVTAGSRGETMVGLNCGVVVMITGRLTSCSGTFRVLSSWKKHLGRLL